MNEQQDHELQHFAKTQLQQHATQLDEHSRARLRSARHQALTLASRSVHRPLWAGAAFAAALTLTLAVLFWQKDPSSQTPHDKAVMAQSEDLELIENWEFYEWLEVLETSPQQHQSSFNDSHYA